MRRLIPALVLAGTLTALAVPAAPASAADTGMLRAAHLSPDSPAVDVTVDDVDDALPPVTLPDLGYGAVSGYRELPAGSYAVGVRPAGADPTSPPVLSTTVELGPGAVRTVAGVGSFADLSLAVLDDDPSPPAAGSARVRVLAAAAGARRLDVGAAGAPPLASGLAFGSAGGYVDVPAGPTTLQVAAEGEPGTSVPLPLAAGSVYSVLVLDRDGGGLSVRLVRDAAGPAATPVGGVDAGVVAGTDGGRTVLPAERFPAAAGLLATGRVAPPLTPLAAVASALAAALGRPMTTAAARDAAPAQLQVPAIGVDAPVAALGLDRDGALAAPADPAQAGWLAAGPAPGEVGPAVLTGHVSYRGPAVFARLAELGAGDEVLVRRSDGSTARFVVTRVARYPKAAFPTAEVYGPTPDAQLRLITCGGDLDRTRHSYADNVVVYAKET